MAYKVIGKIIEEEDNLVKIQTSLGVITASYEVLRKVDADGNNLKGPIFIKFDLERGTPVLYKEGESIYEFPIKCRNAIQNLCRVEKRDENMKDMCLYVLEKFFPGEGVNLFNNYYIDG
ncbi:MAG: hypothetical protein N4A38_04545 [Candidatus Gracilibacteria bacterium]|jgi:hypothetical protein|nr:hypothetical protein [Candidatus Gracilibacteria bacterium]